MRKLQMVEIFPEEIRVSYDDGSLEIDADLTEETSQHRVDIFIPTKDTPDGDRFIITEERFRHQAALWGPVREALGNDQERERAQMGFQFAEARANIMLRDFISALRQGDVWCETKGQRPPFPLFYRDPRSETVRGFHLYPQEGFEKGRRALGVVSLEADGLRLSVSDLKRFGPFLERLIQLFHKVNQAR